MTTLIHDHGNLIAAFAVGILAGATAGAAAIYFAKRSPRDRQGLLERAQEYNIRALRMQA